MDNQQIPTSMDDVDQLIENNMGLIIQLARSFNPRNEDEYLEFVQLGRIAIWKASKKYDPSLAKFCTFAWWHIKFEILKYINKRKKRVEVQFNDSILIECPKKINTSEYLPTSLSAKENKVIELRLMGYTFVEIGESLGFSKGWANNTYRKAIEKIQHANS